MGGRRVSQIGFWHKCHLIRRLSLPKLASNRITMAYFTPDFVQFFKELKDNNTRDWFTANKKRFENSVKKPFEKFVGEMIRLSREINPEITIEPKDAVFRIYRDTRFSNDKTPYKTHMGALVSEAGRKEMVKPGMYLEISDEHVRMYSGIYMPDKQQLEAVRYGIMDQPEVFAKLIAEPSFVKYFGQVRGDQNKVLAKQFKEAAVGQPLLYNKQYYFFTELPVDWLQKDNLPAELMHRYAACKPLADFLYKAILEN